VLNHYAEYFDDPQFVMPVKRRHSKAVKLRNRGAPRPKHLTEEELHRFLRCLAAGPHGNKYAALATLQYYQALRASEAAAVYWEDIHLDPTTPQRSRLFFRRHICWVRGPKELSYIEAGFKNSDGLGGLKEHPMLPPVFEALAALHNPGATGLVFRSPDGSFLTYRQVQAAYDRAFKKAGLPYRSTHIMRHGGTRKVFDETRGDIGVAQQQLGNRDRKTVEVYAQRSPHAFDAYAKEQWERAKAANSGCEWLQPRAQLSLVKESQ
jgi:integrase